jgi:hypothetical protein
MDDLGAAETRRRSPGWVRARDGREVHALAFRLRYRFWTGVSSAAEDWLLDAVISELEYRHRRALRYDPRSACCCEFCVEPFPWDPSEAFG